jgi:hypothetical protein
MLCRSEQARGRAVATLPAAKTPAVMQITVQQPDTSTNRRAPSRSQTNTVSRPRVNCVSAHSEREEIALAECLLAGMLSPERYQRRMAELAAWDDLRMPLVVPPERGGLTGARWNGARRWPRPMVTGSGSGGTG